MDKKLKIGYFADGPWSHLAFEKLISDESIEISFIVPRTDTRDDTLKNYAEKYKIDYLQNCNINKETSFSLLANYHCDLFVSMSFNQIFKPQIYNIPPLRTINCHAGKLPFYRGRNILNWVLINDEKEFGITVHYINEGIDTGNIILQRTYPISDEDNYATLLDVSYGECAEILYDAIKQIQNGVNIELEQDAIHPVGTYFGPRQMGDERIDWQSSSREIFNFVRALCHPGPNAQTYCKNELVKIDKVSMISDAISYKAIPGQVVGKKGTVLIVKTIDTIIAVETYEYERNIRVGDRFS